MCECWCVRNASARSARSQVHKAAPAVSNGTGFAEVAPTGRAARNVFRRGGWTRTSARTRAARCASSRHLKRTAVETDAPDRRASGDDRAAAVDRGFVTDHEIRGLVRLL